MTTFHDGDPPNPKQVSHALLPRWQQKDGLLEQHGNHNAPLNDWMIERNATTRHTHTHTHTAIYCTLGRGGGGHLTCRLTHCLLKAHTELPYANMVPLTNLYWIRKVAGAASAMHYIYIYYIYSLYHHIVHLTVDLYSVRFFQFFWINNINININIKWSVVLKCWEQGLTKVKFLCLFTQTSPIKMILTLIMQWDHDAVLSQRWANQILVLLLLGVAVNACFPIMAQ